MAGNACDRVITPWAGDITLSVHVQGFIEGKYVPLEEGVDVTASMDIVEAESAEEAATKSGNGKIGINAKAEQIE